MNHRDTHISPEVIDLVKALYREHSTMFLRPIKDNPFQTERNRLIREGMKIMKDLILNHKEQVDAKYATVEPN